MAMLEYIRNSHNGIATFGGYENRHRYLFKSNFDYFIFIAFDHAVEITCSKNNNNNKNVYQHSFQQKHRSFPWKNDTEIQVKKCYQENKKKRTKNERDVYLWNSFADFVNIFYSNLFKIIKE